MRCLGEIEGLVENFNTLVYRGQVYHFRPSGGRVAIHRIRLGETLSVEKHVTNLHTVGGDATSNTVCALDGEILYIGANSSKAECAYAITIGDGPLSRETVKSTTLELSGCWDSISNWTFMVQYAPGKVFATVHCESAMFSIVREGSVLRRDVLGVSAPSKGYMDTVPALVAPGRFLSPGGKFSTISDHVTEISIDAPLVRQDGFIPKGRRAAGSVLVAGRFLLGFGGCKPSDLDDFWVYDIKTKESSSVSRVDGEWHCEDSYVPIYVKGNAVYLVGGWYGAKVHSISLSTIKKAIRDSTIREAFPSEAPDTQEPWVMATTGAAASEVPAVSAAAPAAGSASAGSAMSKAAEIELLKLNLRLVELRGEELELRAQLRALGLE